jgi:hypothetical protein
MPARPRRGNTAAAAARSRRFARLRATALPTLRLAVNPTRSAPSQSPGCGAACRIRPGRTARTWPAATRRKSPRVFSLGRRVVISVPAAVPGRRENPRFAVPPGRSMRRLGRQALAAFRAARGQHPTPAGSGHSRTEAMPTLANKLAGLVSALHGTNSDGNCLISAERAVYGSGPAKSTTAP